MIVRDLREDTPEGTKLIVYLFSSKTCSACPTAVEAVNKMTAVEGVEFVKVDVDEEQRMAENYQVMTLPSFVFVLKGNPVAQLNGVQTVHSLEKTIESSLLMG